MKLATRIAASLAVTALVTGTGAFVAPAAWAADKEKPAAKQGVSKPFSKQINAAQDALNKKSYPEALTILKELQGKSGKSPYDEFVLNELQAFAEMNTQNLAEAARLFEAGASSEFLAETEKPQRMKVLATLYYQVKDYKKAADYGAKAVALEPADDNMYTLVSQAYYLGEDYANTLKFVDQYVQKDLTAGAVPKEQTLLLGRSACLKMDDAACTSKATEKLVTYHQKPEYWQQLLDPMFRQKGQSNSFLLNVYRLAADVDALRTSDDYLEFADLAMQAGSPGEAQSVLEKGVQKSVFTGAATDRAKKMLESAKTQAATDQAGLDKVAKDAAASQVGSRDVGVGLAYLSYKQYDKAVDALQRGLGKSGVKDPNEARLLLGMAQLASGKKDDANTTFKAVKGDPQLERLANLWALRTKPAGPEA
jgi:tetratricopeptide (TPR) repeat protein